MCFCGFPLLQMICCYPNFETKKILSEIRVVNQINNKVMKKISLFFVILIFPGISSLMAQFNHINPIPSYNYMMTDEFASFQELGPVNQTREKRDMDVEVTTSSRDETKIFATVWVVKKNGSQVLGPFTVYHDELLSVEIDGGKWGVIIQCAWDVNVSVWIDKVQPRTLNDILENQIQPISPFIYHNLMI